MSDFRRLCVYCGSSEGSSPLYRQAAVDLGAAMAREGIELVYGGGKVGLMGIVADAVLSGGGRVYGIIPEALAGKENAHDGLTELEVVGSMHVRKKRMADLSDGFVAMPGGLGTFEELFETWTWGQLGWHDKPVALLNVAGFYDGMVGFLDSVVSNGFVKQDHRDMLVVESEVDPLIDRLRGYVPPVAPKWLGRTDL